MSAHSRVKSLTGEAHFFEETINIAQVKKMLDNRTGAAGDAEKIEGMKWLLAQISKGRDVSQFFPAVVKTVSTKSIELKKMAYMFLVHYADSSAQCREMALLAINSYQKDLADANQLIRALALRVLTSIRVREIVQIQLIAVKKCVTDASAYVRKAAAHGVPKLFGLDQSLRGELAGVVARLLEDRETMVLSSAIAAFAEVCPDRTELLHPHYRKLCHLLADLDEWGQIVLMDVMLRYARTQFLEPPERSEADGRMAGAGSGFAGFGAEGQNAYSRPMSLKDFYDDDEDAGGSPGDEERPKKLEKRARGKRAAPDRAAPDRGSGSGSSGSDEEKGSTRGGASDIDAEAARQVQARKERYEMDKDHKLLLRSALPLLKSRNAGVVLGVASLYYYLGSGSPTICSKVGRALTRELRNHREIAYVVLCNVAQMCERWPNMFRPELKEFYVRDGDPSFARLLKLKILCRIANRGVAPLILREMETYVRDPDKRFVEAAIRAVGEIAKRIPEVAGRCLSGLMALVRSPDPDVVAAAVVVVRRLLQTHRGNERAVRRLVGLLDSTSVPAARSSIVWIVGEFQDVLRTESADVLRKLAKGFRGEESEVKMQIVNLAVRLHLARRADDSRDASDDRVAQLAAYVLQLAKYDLDYDLRDRSRLLEGLVVAPPPADDAADPSVREEATSVLVRPAGGGDDEEAAAHEDAAAARAAEAAQPRFVLGSLSHCVDHAAFGYRRLPAWPAEAPDPSVREAPEEPQEQDADAAKRRRKERKRAQRESASFYASDEENDSDGSGSGSSSSSSSSSSDDGSGSDGSSSDGGSSDDSDESGSSGSSESDSNDGSEYDGSSASSSSSSDSGSDDDGASPPRGGRRGRKNKGGSRAEAAVGGLLDGLGDFGGGSPAGGSSPARGSSGPAPGGGGLLDMFDALDVSGSGSGNSQAPGAPLSPGGDLLSGLGGAAPGGGEDLLSGLGALGPAAGPTAGASLNAGDSVPADELRRLPLLRPALGNGLKVDAVFLREPSMYGERMNVVRLELENTKPQALERLRMIRVACPGGGSVRAFPEVPKILGGTKMRCKVHCDFAGKEEAVKFSLSCSRGIFPVELKPPLGELLTPLAMDGEAFASARKTMGGMQEASTSVSVAPSKMTGLLRRVLTAANIASVQGGDFVATGQARFAGRTIGSGTTVLFSVEVDAGTGEGRVSVNCANAMLSSTFLRTIKRAAMGE